MLDAVTGFFTIETIVFCVVIWFATLIVRRVVQKVAKLIGRVFPDKWEPYWINLWREDILPWLPLVTGGALAWQIDDYPYPESLAVSLSSKIFYGIVCGAISGLVYRRIKPLIKKFAPKKVKEIEKKLTEGLGPEDEETLPGEEAEKQLEATTEVEE
jgi:hypothetical protein